jgi:hypothetical protein
MSDTTASSPVVRWLLGTALFALFMLSSFALYVRFTEGARPAWAEFLMPATLALLGILNLQLPNPMLKRSWQIGSAVFCLAVSALMLLEILV